jgi:hypothetical protein
MTLKIIGSGLGRTGTLSLKAALEQLGFGPCHHMVEVFMHPDSVPHWVAAGEGKADWEAIYGAYTSTVDYPGAAFWRELVAAYPDAKVVHSVRDPEKWFESTQATIFSPDRPVDSPPGPMQDFFRVLFRTFGDKMHDRTYMVDYFKRHTAEVVATVPKKQLLVYEAAQGWEPLCGFLGVAVPATPFPSVNSREDFNARRARADPDGDGVPNADQVRAALNAELKAT